MFDQAASVLVQLLLSRSLQPTRHARSSLSKIPLFSQRFRSHVTHSRKDRCTDEGLVQILDPQPAALHFAGFQNHRSFCWAVPKPATEDCGLRTQSCPHLIQPHVCRAAHADRVRRGARQVDAAAGDERPAIVDPDHHAAPGAEMGDGDQRAKRQRAIRSGWMRRHLLSVKDLARCGTAAATRALRSSWLTNSFSA